MSLSFVQTASSIAIASAKMSQVMSQTTETISIVRSRRIVGVVTRVANVVFGSILVGGTGNEAAKD